MTQMSKYNLAFQAVAETIYVYFVLLFHTMNKQFANLFFVNSGRVLYIKLQDMHSKLE